MAGHDIHNDVTPVNRNKSPQNTPSVGQLRTAIAASGVSASYPTATLQGATKNDLIMIARQHGIAVAGLN